MVYYSFLPVMIIGFHSLMSRQPFGLTAFDLDIKDLQPNETFKAKMNRNIMVIIND